MRLAAEPDKADNVSVVAKGTPGITCATTRHDPSVERLAGSSTQAQA